MQPRGLAWSPDSRWLAFTAKMPSGQTGLWLYNPATQVLRHVSDKEPDWFSWSPDGKQLVGQMDTTIQTRPRVYSPTPPITIYRGELWLFDVSDMVK
ncbi:MAG: hypothetical protein WCF84_20145 [Anaerolineae bacterium]